MIEKLKTSNFALMAAIFSILLVQTPHTVTAFASVSQFEPLWAYLHGLMFAITLEAGIVYFTVKQRLKTTIFFMLMVTGISTGYYWEQITNGSYAQVIFSLIITIGAPVMIWRIAEETKYDATKRKRKVQQKPSKPVATKSDDVIERAMQLIDQGYNISTVAAMVGKNKSTVSRWNKKRTIGFK